MADNLMSPPASKEGTPVPGQDTQNDTQPSATPIAPSGKRWPTYTLQGHLYGLMQKHGLPYHKKFLRDQYIDALEAAGVQYDPELRARKAPNQGTTEAEYNEALARLSQRNTRQNSNDASQSNNNAGQSNAGQSNAGQSNAGQSNAGQSNTGQSNNNAGQSNAGQSNAGQSNAGQSNTGQSNNNAGQSNAGQSNAGQSNTGQSNDNAGQSNAGQNGEGGEGGDDEDEAEQGGDAEGIDDDGEGDNDQVSGSQNAGAQVNGGQGSSSQDTSSQSTDDQNTGTQNSSQSTDNQNTGNQNNQSGAQNSSQSTGSQDTGTQNGSQDGSQSTGNQNTGNQNNQNGAQNSSQSSGSQNTGTQNGSQDGSQSTGNQNTGNQNNQNGAQKSSQSTGNQNGAQNSSQSTVNQNSTQNGSQNVGSQSTQDEYFTTYDCSARRRECSTVGGTEKPGNFITIQDPEGGKDIQAEICGMCPGRATWLAVALPGKDSNNPKLQRGYWVNSADYPRALLNYKENGSNYTLSKGDKNDLKFCPKAEDFELNLVLVMPWGRTFHTYGLGRSKGGMMVLFSKSAMAGQWGMSAAVNLLETRSEDVGQAWPVTGTRRDKIRMKAWKQ